MAPQLPIKFPGFFTFLKKWWKSFTTIWATISSHFWLKIKIQKKSSEKTSLGWKPILDCPPIWRIFWVSIPTRVWNFMLFALFEKWKVFYGNTRQFFQSLEKTWTRTIRQEKNDLATGPDILKLVQKIFPFFEMADKNEQNLWTKSPC